LLPFYFPFSVNFFIDLVSFSNYFDTSQQQKEAKMTKVKFEKYNQAALEVEAAIDTLRIYGRISADKNVSEMAEEAFKRLRALDEAHNVVINSN
jgi:hypothetical protein